MKPFAIPMSAILAGLSITGSVHASQSTVSVPTPNACAVLMGGGGMVFPSDKQNQQWFLVGRAVSQAAEVSLQGMGYRIYPLIVDVRDSAQRLHLLSTELAREQCNQVVQITHRLSGESATQPGVAKDFAFDVAVLDVAPDGKLTGVYNKTYSYPLTRETMVSLSMSTVGKTIASDIENAKVLTMPAANTTSSIGHGG